MSEMNPTFLIVDLFCGAGGTTTGFVMAKDGLAKVIACVNHDAKAIESHWKNHPEVKHFEEDIRTLDLTELKEVVTFQRSLYPDAKLILWASLECTNFSKAKGGQPRDADSRTLADHLHRYVSMLQPDYVMIENVVEFMSWGPLNEAGKPVSRKNGSDYLRWCREMCEHGYVNDWKELNSADFGAYTSRNRLFGVFARPHLPITWPEATHSKSQKLKVKSQKGLYGNELLPWMPVKDVLDFSDEGESIFNRKIPLKERTLNVVLKGLVKAFNNNDDNFLISYYGNSNEPHLTNSSIGTLTTKDRYAIFTILRDYISGFVTSIDNPLGSIPAVPKAHLLSFILNPSHGGHTTGVDNPCPVVIARQDKAPLYLIKAFMDENGISDIKMRMLRVHELLKIQGFPNDYVLCGNQSDQKKFIGNSVVPLVVKVWAEALAERIIGNRNKKVA